MSEREINRVRTLAPASSRLPPLTSVHVVLHQYPHVAALPHIETLLNDYLDYGLPQSWTLLRACEKNFPHLIQRLLAHSLATGVDPYYWKYQCRQGLVFAVKNDNLAMVEWIHKCCPTVLPYLPMIEAARTGNIGLLEWLTNRHKDAEWPREMMDAAAATGQLLTLQWLHNHPKNTGCTAIAFTSAVFGNHLDVVRWLHEHYAEQTRPSDKNMKLIPLRGAFQGSPGVYTDTAKFVLENEQYSLWEVSEAKQWFARQGDLKMIQWIHARFKDAFLLRSIDSLFGPAIQGGQLHVLQWIHENFPVGRSPSAMDAAAAKGNLEVLQWLHENRPEGCTSMAMDLAAAWNHLPVVKWLHETRTEGCTTDAMDEAAAAGNLEIVKWLHENRVEGCTPNAMNRSAGGGHLDVLKWLHANRIEGCTYGAMNRAASAGHFDVVKWLHEYRTEGCTTNAMNLAAAHGHLETVKWLRENRAEGSSRKGMCLAASGGHLEVVKWLHSNRAVRSRSDAMTRAAGRGGYRERVRGNRSEGRTTNALTDAAANGHFDVVLFLHANRRKVYSRSIMDGPPSSYYNMELMQWLSEHYPAL